MRKALKKIFYSAGFRTGLHRLDKKKYSRLILMYHGISSRDLSAINGRHLPAAQFEKQLRYFAKHFNILGPQELLNDPGAGGNRPGIALTFDDGFENNFTVALPLLQKHKVPASFYIPSVILEREVILPADQLDIVRAYSPAKEFEFAGRLFKRRGPHRLLDKKTGENIYETFLNLSPQEVEIAIREFALRYELPLLLEKTDPSAFRLMNAEQVRALSQSTGVTIGSHARSHFALSTCPHGTLKEELSSSKKALEDAIGKTVHSLAFPYGDFNEQVVEQSKKAGYEVLLAAGPAHQAKSVLPRVAIISGGTLEQNLLHVHKAFDKFGF